MRMLGKIFTLFTLVSLAQCACKSTKSANGTVSALCTDETSGLDFELINVHEKWTITDTQPATPEMLAGMYADYERGIRPRNKTLSKRAHDSKTDHLTTRWARCALWIQGVCADDNVISWGGTDYAYKRHLTELMVKANGHRMEEDPRALCKESPSGTICLQWAANLFGVMEKKRVKVMVDETWWHCQFHGYSAEIKYRNNIYQQYLCVSSRTTGCVENCDMDYCSNMQVGWWCDGNGYGDGNGGLRV